MTVFDFMDKHPFISVIFGFLAMWTIVGTAGAMRRK